MKYCDKVSGQLEKFYSQALDVGGEGELFSHIKSCENCQIKFKNDYDLIKILNISSKIVGPKRNISDAVIAELKPVRKKIYYYAAAAIALMVFGIALFFPGTTEKEIVISEKKAVVESFEVKTAYNISGGNNYEIIRDGHVYNSGSLNELKPGTELYSFSNIDLGCSFMKVRMNNKAHLTLGEDDLRFHFGTVKFDFKKLERPFHIITKNSTITITGTSFTLYKHSVDSTTTTFELTHGSVELEHKSGNTLIIQGSGKFQITDTEIVNLDGTEVQPKDSHTAEVKSFSLEK
ncbi:FecR domain-containing protein [bacterium]|nr:FecR domain-containing protein [bacterium]